MGLNLLFWPWKSSGLGVADLEMPRAGSGVGTDQWVIASSWKTERNKGDEAFAMTDICCVIPVFPRSFLLNQIEKYKAPCWDLQPVLGWASWCQPGQMEWGNSVGFGHPWSKVW